TNFKAASGRLDARFEGATGPDESARTPLTGELALMADRGLFQIERANLRTGATELNARGRFSFEGGSDLAVNLNSADAAELQSVVIATGLLPDLEERVKEFGVQLAGNLSFNGTLSGDLDDPLVNGRFELASLTMRGRDLGALSADVVSNASETRVTNGRLAQPGGGGAQFAAVIPRAGENNVSFEATLENADVSSLLLALGGDAPAEGEGGGMSAQSLAGLGRASGRVSVTGYPGAMAGSADLRVGSGVIGSQAYDEIVARATFSGSRVNVETVEARLAAGRVTASGNVDIEQKSFDFRAEGTGVRLDLLGGVLPAGRGAPRLGGIADFTASASGNILDPTSYRAEINARGRDVTINGQPAGELTLVGTTTADQKFNLELTTGLLGSPQVIRAQVDLAGEEGIPLIVETTLAGADLTPLFSALLPGSGVRVTGTATGSLRASGNLLDEEGGFTTSALSGRAEFTTLNVQIEDVALEAVSPLVVVFTPREITFEQTRFRGPGTNISFGGKAAIAAGGTNDVTVEGALNLGVLSNPGQNFFLSGAANVAVSVKGAYESPRLTGTASLANASFALLVSNQRLVASEINGLVRFNETNASIESLTGRLGGGRVSATGGVLLAGFRPVQFRVVARGDEVTVPFPADFRTTADAELEISGRLDSQIIKGTVNVRRSEYTENLDLADLIDQRREAPITEGGGGGGGGLLAGSVTTLDLIIQGRDALVVRNNLADMVGSISLRARGTVDDPLISGRITVTRGTLAFRNEQFELQRGIIDLPPRR
ncbi:MAG TPA: translocation/assembly module TamB domain-containing protein, partial [Pyrinomonadaceae bacterium]|nr:translocation/assembly module TamB domain-containing protein [Pyrinomonadaceae bacterium]